MRLDLTDIHARVRFRDFRLTESPSGTCEAEVVLGWDSGAQTTGKAQGVNSSTGILRCAAEAAIVALDELVIEYGISLDLLGVKSIKAFDSVVVIVSLTSNVGDNSQRLVGSCIIQEDAPRGAALAVLNATNRLVGNMIHSR